MRRNHLTTRKILTDQSVRNAMAVHAAFGGSTNLLLHIPAIAFHGQLQRPRLEDWIAINRAVPRLVDVLPNGPIGHPTIRVFLAGAVPEVMLHLRALGGLLDESAITVTGMPLGSILDTWINSERRKRLRECLYQSDGIDPDEVILSPKRAREKGLTSTITFPGGNLVPGGSVIKSTAIDPSVLDHDNIYRKVLRARVFTTERAAVAALKAVGEEGIKPGDVIVLICRGPLGAGMEEIYQITAALRHLSWGKQVAVLTDARFSGVSTGACIGHISPEALAGGPIGKVLDNDRIEIVIDRTNLEGSVNLVGHGDVVFGAAKGADVLTERKPRPDLRSDPQLPDDTRLWATLIEASGGIWNGCVYDVEAICEKLARTK
jgi:putative YjhG/YagF family dehydratase